MKGVRMNTKRILCLLMWLVMPACWGLADEGDIEVKFPKEQRPVPRPLSEAEKERKDKERIHSALVAQVNKKLPYHDMFGDATCRFFTLGQLIKLSDSVSIVKVVDVEDVGPELPARRQVPNIKLTIQAETNLLDRLDQRDLSLTVHWWDRKRIPKKGDRWLVCITHEDYRITMLDTMQWDFDKSKSQSKPKDATLIPRQSRSALDLSDGETGCHILGQSRGAINLCDSKTEREFLAAATGYIMNLRQQRRDAEKYYSLLRGLIRSPVSRIQDDAKIDLLNFLKTCPSFDLNRIIDDDTMDDGIKEYVRLILQPSRQSQKAP